MNLAVGQPRLPGFDRGFETIVSSGELAVQIKQVDGMSVVTASGHLLRHTADQLSTAVDLACRTGTEMIVVDLGEVTLLDTVALGVCMAAAFAARSGGHGVVVLPPAGHDDGSAGDAVCAA